MVKKFVKNQEEFEDADFSDLEVDYQDGDLDTGSNIINDEEGLTSGLKKIKQDFNKMMKSQNSDWIETMDLTAEENVDPELNVDDDIKRELIFYNLSLSNAATGISKLKELGEKLNRPGDFFAEMLKGDNQMEKVRKQIVHEKMRIKKLEEKKNKMQNIKFAKAMKDSQNKEKSAARRRTKEGIESWKKHIKNNPNDYHKIDEFIDGKRGNNKGGFRGGKNKGQFRGGKQDRFGGSKFQKGGKNKNQRPGKVKRMIQRNKKNSTRK